MKKWISLILCFAFIFALPGCGNNNSTDNSSNQSASVNYSSVDVDLTTLSSTMVYSEVYNMVTSPQNYIGKKVKMKGKFATYYDQTTGNNYFGCIISDATACCSQGIEFVLTDDYTYPADYPKDGEDICVVGVFETFQEGNYTYCRLKDAKLV